MEKGASSQKLVMGIPLYGQSFTLSNANVHGLNAPASGPGEAGKFTRAAGFLAYYEVWGRGRLWKRFRLSAGFNVDVFAVRRSAVKWPPGGPSSKTRNTEWARTRTKATSGSGTTTWTWWNERSVRVGVCKHCLSDERAVCCFRRTTRDLII